MRGRSFANLARVLSQRDIATVMQAIFDRPVVANQFQQAEGIGSFGGKAGEPIHLFLRALQGILDPSA